jgi:glucose uptake protein
MLLPTTYFAGVALLVLGMFGWGVWGNTLKLAKWRFEVYYFDFAWGAALCALGVALSLGSMNPQELTFGDNFLIAGYRKMAWAVGAGVVFNLGNMLLVASLSVAGMSVSFPIAMGVSIIVGLVPSLISNTQGNPILAVGGMVVVGIAITIAAFAYRSHHDALAEAAKASAPPPDPRGRTKVSSPRSSRRGVIAAILGGILIGGLSPLVQEARSGDNGVAPYGLALLVAAGIFFSTVLYSPFFINFPIQGQPVRMRTYFRGTKGQHFFSLLGGVLWMSGLICMLSETSVPATVAPNAAIAKALREGSPVVAALCGLVLWNEFKDGTERVKLLMWFVLLLMIAGVAMISLALFYAAK